MSRAPLSDFARTLAMRLPQTPCRCRDEHVLEHHDTFSAENLPEAPPLLITSDLVMSKTEHHYGNNCRIDIVHFYASGQTHRELGIWILAGLFSGKSQRAALDLKHEASTIKRLEINYSGFDRSACSGFTRKPAQFIYHPEIPNRIPWNGDLGEKDLPMFDLDFREDSNHHPVNDLDKRDKVEIRKATTMLSCFCGTTSKHRAPCLRYRRQRRVCPSRQDVRSRMLSRMTASCKMECGSPIPLAEQFFLAGRLSVSKPKVKRIRPRTTDLES
jgi:hypothetical protein